jgi:DHA2 family multidrug resistance protein
MLGVVPGVALTMLHSTMLDLPRADVVAALDSDRYRIQWIVGSYLLGGAAGMALTGFCGAHFGLRRSYAAAVLLFALAAGACGFVGEVVWMTPWRLLQGLGMGLAISSGMVLIWRAFPRHREFAMAIYGMCVYLPALAGAILGGLLTAWASWRWIFWFNLPLGLLVVGVAAWLLPPDPPRDPGPQPAPFDLVGFALLVCWIGTLNVVLDLGQYWGWLNSPFFVPWLAGFVVSFALFIVWGILAPHPLISLRPFALRNFALGLGIKALFSINLYLLVGLLTGYMINLRGYQWWQGGLVLLPALLTMAAGVAGGVALGNDANRKPRMLLALAVMVLATWQLAGLDLFTSKCRQALLWAVWGAGAGLLVGPALLTVFEDLTPQQATQGAGIFNIVRALPAFAAHGLLATLLVQRTDAHFDLLRQTVTSNRPQLETVYRQSSRYFTDQGSSPAIRGKQAQAVLGRWVHANARAFALQDVLRVLAVGTAAGLGLIVFVRRPGGIAA